MAIDLNELAAAIGQLTLRFRLRRRTAAEWTSSNEVLLDSEQGFEHDTGRFKIGDGTTPWNSLAYLPSGNVRSIVAGTNVTVDDSDPENPIVNAAGGGGGGGSGSWPAATAPAAINGLVHWFDSSLLPVSAGAKAPQISSPDPLRCPTMAYGGHATVIASLNSLATVTFPGAATGNMVITTPFTFSEGCTVFVVHKPGTMVASGNYTILGGNNGSFDLRITETAANTGQLQIISTNTAAIGNSTTTVTTGNAFQGNVTFDPSTGDYAFRIGQASAGSGTSVRAITAPTSTVGYDGGSTGGAYLNGDLAELIVFNDVLTLTQIQAVEAYLHAKWGV